MLAISVRRNGTRLDASVWVLVQRLQQLLNVVASLFITGYVDGVPAGHGRQRGEKLKKRPPTATDDAGTQSMKRHVKNEPRLAA